MTQKEAVYWRNFIEKIIDEKVPYIKRSDVDSRKISDFAQRFMVTITGQQYLPQGIFRNFLSEFGDFPIVIDELKEAQEALNELIDGAECSTKEVECLFDGEMYEESEDYMWLPSMDIDDDGYVALNILIDDDGYANFVND